MIMDKATKRAKAGRPKGWSPKTGWFGRGLVNQQAAKRRDLIDSFEGLCCAQVEKIERNLARTYGADYDGRIHSVGNLAAHNKFHAMPQNDAMTRLTLMRDGVVEWRGSCGAMGRNQGGAQ
jgi:hypothetical protein